MQKKYILGLVVAVIAIDATLQNGVIETNELEGQEKILRAVILDQLSEEIPNKHFQKRATEILEGAGYEVDRENRIPLKNISQISFGAML